MGVLQDLQQDFSTLLKTAEEISSLQAQHLFKIDMNDRRNFDPEQAEKIQERVNLLQRGIYFPLKEKLGL